MPQTHGELGMFIPCLSVSQTSLVYAIRSNDSQHATGAETDVPYFAILWRSVLYRKAIVAHLLALHGSFIPLLRFGGAQL